MREGRLTVSTWTEAAPPFERVAGHPAPPAYPEAGESQQNGERGQKGGLQAEKEGTLSQKPQQAAWETAVSTGWEGEDSESAARGP